MDVPEMVEKVARAIYEAIDPSSGDQIAVTLHTSEFVHADTVAEQLEMVMETCRSAARAAIEAFTPLVERAFRDGLTYGNNVKGADADLAWQHSRAKAALSPPLKEQERT